jgi:C-terminal binding protein
MRVIFYDNFVSDGMAKAIGASRCETLLQLAQQSDCVSIHCASNASTKHIINAEFLVAMPRGSFLVNTARGDIVDEDALYRAIVSNHLGGCAVDVVEHEPATSDHRLLGLPNCLITPHIAWFSQQSIIEKREEAADTVKHIALGLPIRNLVNKQFLAA